jgi:serine/threonine-protein kinase
MDAPNTSPRSSPYGSCRGEPPTAPIATRPATDSAPTPSLPAAGPPVRAFGSYELLEEIDRGGMGVVYKARQAGLDRLVALKMILSGPAAQREEVLRFLREARAAGRLRHANIIAVHDAGTIDGQHYFTMPLARNGSLARHVKRLGAEPRAAVALVEKVARAVQHAHDNGIVHRDLKPANVLLDEGDEPWVADFGLAKVEGADELRTRTGRGLGTPAYMAPEQSDPALGRSSGPAADVWALGVILDELLAGRRPFRGRHETVLHRIREDDPARPSRLRPGVDANLEAVVLKCLEKEPARRYPSAGALADDLASWLRGEAPWCCRRARSAGPPAGPGGTPGPSPPALPCWCWRWPCRSCGARPPRRSARRPMRRPANPPRRTRTCGAGSAGRSPSN